MKIGLLNMEVAQLVAHMARNHDVAGSNPAFEKIELMHGVKQHLQLLIVLGFVWTVNYEPSTILFLNSFW